MNPHPRDHLVDEHLHLVKRAAARLGRSLPRSIDRDELFSAGLFGLLQAARAYDPARANKFASYAGPRIHGAMLDYLREADWLPRSARTKVTRVSRARDHLLAELGRQPTWEELAEASGESPATVHWALSTFGQHRSEESQFDNGEELAFAEQVEAPREADAGDLRDLLRIVCRGLNPAACAVIVGKYYRQQTMAEIADELGCCASRISQLHSELLPRIRRRLAAREAELAG